MAGVLAGIGWSAFGHGFHWLGGSQKSRWFCNEQLLMLARRGSCVQAGCPWAWWWLAWRGWRTSSCLQTGQPGKLRWPPEGPSRQSSGSAGRSWSPERSHGPGAGRAACGSTARWISGSDGSHGERQFQVGTCEVSSLHRWPARSFALPWWRAVFVEPFLQLICERSAWYVPFWRTIKNNRISPAQESVSFLSLARSLVIGQLTVATAPLAKSQ